jgi:predicted nucleic acid-binding protein
MIQFMVDSNVLLDLVTADPVWYGWSAETLARCAETGPLVINPIIFAELSYGYERIEQVREIVANAELRYDAIPFEAAFLAARCFEQYRHRGGTRTVPLPDFFIGAHAMVSGCVLVTRDPKRYRSSLPTLELICPSK